MLINDVKMPRVVSILTFIIRINTQSVRIKQETIFIFSFEGFYEQLKFQAEWSMKSFRSSGPGCY